MQRLLIALLCGCVLFTARVAFAAEVHPGMLRYPDVSATQIVFVYDNDVWIAPKEGGQALPLSSPAGMEVFPRFRPDGARIAYSAAYDGNEDVYEMPVTGGVPIRLTIQPYGARVVDYSPDGRVVFATGEIAIDETQLWYADPNCGLPSRLPLKYGDLPSFSADGTWVAFTPWRHVWQDSSWNRYQGGQAADVWTFNLQTHESHQLTSWPGTDDVPMVSGSRVYYISDAGPEHRRNIWFVDTANDERAQVTHFTDAEVRWPALGPQDIVFQNGGKLWRMPLDTLVPVEVHISLSGDLPHARPYTLDLQGGPDSARVSPSAKRVVVEKRGDVWTIPAKDGYNTNLTPTDGCAERDPAWSPDGKWIAYVCDESGHYELYVRPADGSGAARQLTRDSATRMFGPSWSPDSKAIAYVDRTSTYYCVEVESGKRTAIATDPYGSFNNWTSRAMMLDWSPDSKWIAYVLKDDKTQNDVVHIYNCESKDDHAVTSPDFPSGEPTFDTGGDFLYFTTGQGLSPIYSDFDPNLAFANTTELSYLPLRKDVASPFLPTNDEEPGASAKPADQAKSDKADKDKADAAAKPKDGAAAAPPAPKPVKIDFDGIVARAQALPVEAGNYGSLQAGERKLYYLRYPNTGSSRGSANELKLFDLAAVQANEPSNPANKTLLPGVYGYQLTPDRSKMLVFANGAMFITAAAQGAALDHPVPFGGLRKQIDPQHEWRQMVIEDYQIFKEKFYDPHMHGVNWDAARDRALAMLPYATCTEDVGFILSEMNAEVNVGHAFVGSGQSSAPPDPRLGMLGCDFEAATDAAGHKGIRISRIYHGGAGELGVSGPLGAPGVDVHDGDFLIAVNGIALDPARSPYEMLLGKAGTTLKLSVGPSAMRDDKTRDVLVRADGYDYELRHRDWVRRNREYVAQQSAGRVGYIHVRDTGGGGIVDLQRQLLGQYNCDALIIDERYNHGGDVAHQFIELLNRPVQVYCAPRYGKGVRIPASSAPGPKVMLVNQYAGSGGDCFPYLFRQAALGPIVGVRTWGGLVGLSGGEMLLDGTFFVVPSLALYRPDSQWLVEGYGTDPDIVVVNDPTSTSAGTDAQLDRAIAEALAQADAHPWQDAPIPAYVDRSGVRTEQ